MWGEIATGPTRPTDQTDRVHKYVTLGVTLHRLGGQPAELGSENVGIDVTKWAESIGEGIRARGHSWIAQPEITDSERYIVWTHQERRMKWQRYGTQEIV